MDRTKFMPHLQQKDKYTLNVLQIQGTSQHHNATIKHGLKPKDYVNILRI